ncbi:HlyD family secretion protein [Pseudodonghicola xiamenensis]|uniref:Hemolysin secretion protein D n=1 Tax=Pseudodonghicola xiamenensis TaxID=337702 RepID=A0A8J3MGW8_9RHOB|nr:HlyD family efflux transporter periplasmic adaptor subunit [Pseudodonghicola xiamenensis]GHH03258.1 hemolysin secretion protein D [Pseudodonghicola xiamenensis]
MSGLLCSLPLIGTLFGACADPASFATGYVEGEYLLIAPVATAQIEDLPIRRGDRVAAGDLLVEMEKRDATIALAQAEAALARAENELADLKLPKRDEEIHVIEAELASAKAEAVEAAREAERQKNLYQRNTTPKSQMDAAATALDVARAKVAETEASLAVARLPARPDVIAAAEAAVAEARAARESAAWQLSKRTLTAPAAGKVTEILRRTGEIAGPQAPVLSFLPDGGVLLRVYVPETEISSIKVGSRLTVNCDGCEPGMVARVSYVSDAPEFTPPVIYSLDNRQKLVYLIEARPEAGTPSIQPGQIVDVALEPKP